MNSLRCGLLVVLKQANLTTIPTRRDHLREAVLIKKADDFLEITGRVPVDRSIRIDSAALKFQSKGHPRSDDHQSRAQLLVTVITQSSLDRSFVSKVDRNPSVGSTNLRPT